MVKTNNLPSLDPSYQPTVETAVTPAAVADSPAPKRPSPSVRPTSQHVNEIAEDYEASLLEADHLLKDIDAANRPASHAELTFFQRQCSWSDVEVRQQLRRMHNVASHQRIAGTMADRQSSRIEATKAADVYEKQAPKLEAEIEKLQSSLRSLENDKRLSSKRVEQQSEAVLALRTLAPEHVRAANDLRKRIVKESLGREFHDRQIRLREIENLLDPSRYLTPLAHLESVRRSYHQAVGHSEFGRLQFTPEWPPIEAEIRAELVTLAPEVAKLETEFAEALASLESELDFYSN